MGFELIGSCLSFIGIALAVRNWNSINENHNLFTLLIVSAFRKLQHVVFDKDG